MYVLWEYMCASLLCKVRLFFILLYWQYVISFITNFVVVLNEIGEFFFRGDVVYMGSQEVSSWSFTKSTWYFSSTQEDRTMSPLSKINETV